MCTFGRSSLVRDGQELDLPPGKLSGLLVYVATYQAVPQPRDRLMSLLWGTHFSLQSRQNLRKALSRLRHILGDDVLLADDSTVRLRPGAIDLDASAFEQLVATGSEDDVEVALSLYAGEFLADLSIEQKPWVEWLSMRRKQLKSLAVDGLARSGAAALRDGLGAKAVEAAMRAIALDPLREDAHRVLIRALSDSGRRNDALRAYRDLRERLRRELDVEPDATTQAVAEAVRQTGSAAVPPPGASSATRRLPTGEPAVSGEAPRLTLPDGPSIAVLPFENVGGDAAQDYFADGLAEDLIAALSRLRWLFVISRRSSFTFKGRDVDARGIGRELGVRYVFEGRIRIDADRVRVATQLIDAETGLSILAHRVEHELSGIFALQDELVERIAAAIEPGIRHVEIERAKAKPTASMGAYDVYLRALPEIYKLREDRFAQAVALLREAVALDPEYSEALATLADCRVRQWSNGWLPTRDGADVQIEGVELAQRAVVADPRNGLALAVLAYALVVCQGRFDEALELVERANLLQPSSDYVLALCGQVVVNAGQSDRAIEFYNKARRLNPVDARAHVTLNGIAMAHFHAGHFEDAEHWARLALAERPDWNVARRYRAAALAHLGRLTEARGVIAELRRTQPNASLSRSRMSNFRFAYMYDQYIGGLCLAGLPEDIEVPSV